MIRNKKGDGSFLSSNAFSLIIAAIGIGLLVFGFVKLYQATTDEESRAAQKTLDNIIEKMDILKNGESNNFLIQGFKGANDWYFVSWNENEGGRPDKCFFGSCLCLCNYGDSEVHAVSKENVGSVGGNILRALPLIGKIAENEPIEIKLVSKSDTFSSVCQEKGFCRKIDRSISLKQSIFIQRTGCDLMDYDPELEYDYLGTNKAKIPYFKLSDVINQVSIDKEKDQILIYHEANPRTYYLRCESGKVPTLKEP